MILKELYAKHKDLARQKAANTPYDIQFYNFWKQSVPDMWFYRFIQSHQLLKDKKKKICFYSTFGNRDTIDKSLGDVNVFFTGENLKHGIHAKFADHLLSDRRLNLAMGFECFDDARYIRFPLWLLYMFDPESREEDVVRRCVELNRPNLGDRQRFACHVSSVDEIGLRKRICLELARIGQVDCAGKTMHNCDDLWKMFGDDKKAFLMNYKLNVCPENSNAMGYVTEKVFQAVEAGCVPIYWGSYNYPEPEVLNHQAVLFWEKEGDNAKLLDFIGQLNASQSFYEDFAMQDRLKPSAAEYVIDKFDQLEKRISDLL